MRIERASRESPLSRASQSIHDGGRRGLARAIRAAEHDSVHFRSMPDDAAAASGADRRQGVDGAFETVEYIGLAVPLDLERLVVDVAAGDAGARDHHNRPPSVGSSV